MHGRRLVHYCLLLLGTATTSCNTSAAPARVETPTDSIAGEIPFELAGPGGAALIVPVFINGEGPYQFVLDTGATITCVDQALAQQLSLSEARGVLGSGATVTGTGQVRMLQIDSLRVGSARALELLGCELDLQHTGQLGFQMQGLLGLNFLKSFRVTLDFERNVLHLRDP